jgi:molecular chaperone DnaK
MLNLKVYKGLLLTVYRFYFAELINHSSFLRFTVEVKVFQGERELVRDNKLLGNFVLDGIPPAPKGTPLIEVTFDVDADGIVNVSAKDKGTNRDQSITIAASSGLSSDEINKMIKDAETHAESDNKRKEVIVAINSAESVINETEKNMMEHKDQIDQEESKKIKEQIKKLQEFVKKGEEVDPEEIKKETHGLLQSSLKLFEAVYKKAQEKNAQSSNTSNTTPEDASSSA